MEMGALNRFGRLKWRKNCSLSGECLSKDQIKVTTLSLTNYEFACSVQVKSLVAVWSKKKRQLTGQ